VAVIIEDGSEINRAIFTAGGLEPQKKLAGELGG
jgi:hypothetical protein